MRLTLAREPVIEPEEMLVVKRTVQAEFLNLTHRFQGVPTFCNRSVICVDAVPFDMNSIGVILVHLPIGSEVAPESLARGYEYKDIASHTTPDSGLRYCLRPLAERDMSFFMTE